jgi:Domain of unknown function (DUF6471)
MRDIWEEKAANELKAQIKRAGMTYAHLAQQLSKVGIPMEAATLNQKLWRGTFSHSFYLQCVSLVEATIREKER